MTCTCGDTHCGSCGPAQGNWKCFCGAWADDGCEHIDEDGNLKPEFEEEAAEHAEAAGYADLTEPAADLNDWWS